MLCEFPFLYKDISSLPQQSKKRNLYSFSPPEKSIKIQKNE